MTTEDLDLSCCFCGQNLLFSQAIQISVCLTSNMEEVQGLYSHLNCFDNTLDASVPRLFNNLSNAERSTNTQQ